MGPMFAAGRLSLVEQTSLEIQQAGLEIQQAGLEIQQASLEIQRASLEIQQAGLVAQQSGNDIAFWIGITQAAVALLVGVIQAGMVGWGIRYTIRMSERREQHHAERHEETMEAFCLPNHRQPRAARRNARSPAPARRRVTPAGRRLTDPDRAHRASPTQVDISPLIRRAGGTER